MQTQTNTSGQGSRWFEWGESRGVDRVPDRVPERYRVRRPEPVVIAAPEYTRKGIFGQLVPPQPYVNPARDAKSLKSGRLRKELRP